MRYAPRECFQYISALITHPQHCCPLLCVILRGDLRSLRQAHGLRNQRMQSAIAARLGEEHLHDPSVDFLSDSFASADDDDNVVFVAAISTTCELVGSMWSNLIQIMLGVCSGLPLIYKWYTEAPRRSLITFSIDTSKQVLGKGKGGGLLAQRACCALKVNWRCSCVWWSCAGSLTTHFLNLALAEGLSSALVSDITSSCQDDRCVFYFVTFVGDATLCLLFCFLLLKGLKWLAVSAKRWSGVLWCQLCVLDHQSFLFSFSFSSWGFAGSFSFISAREIWILWGPGHGKEVAS